tara:strand:+ start:32 stop:1126 length:1095 start_codon:yes stop_codon:yes gene_type:complete
MNICIIGDGLTSLSLAKNLVNKKINVHIYQREKINNSYSNRTIGITKNNLDFFNREINIFPKRNIWNVKKIEIFSDKTKDDKILNFENKNNLFYIVKNNQLYQMLNNKLLKSKFFKRIIIKKEDFYKKLLNGNKYNLIINCDSSNFIAKKYFYRKIDKDYCNIAYTTILKHTKLENSTAVQVFTKFGPIAFLPMSNTETSVVCSLEIKNKKYTNEEVINLIKKYNQKLKIKKILDLNSFKLKSSNLRNYYYKNVLAFGDSLHKIHPLAGQGFNMTIRDIKIFSKIIQNKIDLGIQLDSLVLQEFEKKTRHLNFVFSNGVDFIYEIFNFDKKTKNKNFSKFLRYFEKNEKLKNIIIKFADNGLSL